jgi:large subunit ribosomal protein L14
MIQMQSMLDAADNSGARRVMCIKVLGGSKRRYAQHRRRHQGQRQGRDSARQGQEGRGLQRRRGAHPQGRAPPDGSLIRFDGNAAVLLNNKLRADRHPHLRAGDARAARKKFMKIISLAPEVL